MRSEMNFVFLCAFVLFTVVYSQEPSSDELKKYSPCYDYIMCKEYLEKVKLGILDPKYLGILDPIKSYYNSDAEAERSTSCGWDVVETDPELLKEFKSCNNALSTKDFQKYFKYLKKNFIPFKSDNLSGAITEYCSYNEAQENDLFDKTIHADFSFQKKTGADGEESIESGLEEITNCVYKLLQKANSEGKCTTL